MSLIPQTLLFGDEPFDPLLSMVNKCPVLNAPTDWKETPEAHLFVTDLPGLTKEEVKVELDENDRVLKISGERKVGDDHNEEEKLGRWHRAERFRGKFLRRFKLPENVKTDNGVIRASMENGVLTVTVPKEEVKKEQPQLKRIIEIVEEEHGNN